MQLRRARQTIRAAAAASTRGLSKFPRGLADDVDFVEDHGGRVGPEAELLVRLRPDELRDVRLVVALLRRDGPDAQTCVGLSWDRDAVDVRVKRNEDAAAAPGYSFAAYRIALKFAPATGSSILMLTTKWASPLNFERGTSLPLKGKVTSKSFAGAGFAVAAGAAAGASAASACSATKAPAPALQRIAARRSRPLNAAVLAASAAIAIM